MNGLQIGDGFKFGCGFFLAAFVAYIVIIIVTMLIFAILGVGFGGLLESMDSSGVLLPLLGVV
ncbi:MAG: hypothetical protein JXM73_21115 [Anaerolineae bacterium]|nr:hypothetical protein [Anaerolineae bacterium]